MPQARDRTPNETSLCLQNSGDRERKLTPSARGPARTKWETGCGNSVLLVLLSRADARYVQGRNRFAAAAGRSTGCCSTAWPGTRRGTLPAATPFTRARTHSVRLGVTTRSSSHEPQGRSPTALGKAASVRSPVRPRGDRVAVALTHRDPVRDAGRTHEPAAGCPSRPPVLFRPVTK
jgi:hypothetical protein